MEDKNIPAIDDINDDFDEIKKNIKNIPKTTIKLTDEVAIKKLNAIHAIAKNSLIEKGIHKNSEQLSFLVARAIDFLYASKEIKDEVGDEKFEQFINKSPLDIEI